MNNAFTKLAFNIMSRLGRNAAAKSGISSKAKAMLGAAGLAGAGALAHHYDMFAPKIIAKQLASEGVSAGTGSIPIAPQTIAKQLASEGVGASNVPIAPKQVVKEIPDNIAEVAPSSTIAGPVTSESSNARQVIKEISRQSNNTEASDALSFEEQQRKALEEEMEQTRKNKLKRLRMQANDFLQNKSVAKLPSIEELNSELALRKSKVYQAFNTEGISSEGSAIPLDLAQSKKTLRNLINARDEAAYLGKDDVIPEINKLIDSHSSALDDMRNNYEYNIFNYDDPGNAPLTSRKLQILRLPSLSRILGYEVNPWGAGANSSTIPMDKEMGGLRISRGKNNLSDFVGENADYSDVRFGKPFREEIMPLDFDSVIKKIHSISGEYNPKNYFKGLPPEIDPHNITILRGDDEISDVSGIYDSLPGRLPPYYYKGTYDDEFSNLNPYEPTYTYRDELLPDSEEYKHFNSLPSYMQKQVYGKPKLDMAVENLEYKAGLSDAVENFVPESPITVPYAKVR